MLGQRILIARESGHAHRGDGESDEGHGHYPAEDKGRSPVRELSHHQLQRSPRFENRFPGLKINQFIIFFKIIFIYFNNY